MLPQRRVMMEVDPFCSFETKKQEVYLKDRFTHDHNGLKRVGVPRLDDDDE